MRRSFPFEDLDDTEFESLVCHICLSILGTGTLIFAAGKDGGRDAAFNGTATKFPSDKSPLSGRFVIQAKHTSNPTASCSDAEFQKIMDGEQPKLVELVNAGELEHYVVFTNRKKPATKSIALEKRLKKDAKLKTVHILGLEQLRDWLTAHPQIWVNLGFHRFERRLEIRTADLIHLVGEFHTALKAKPATQIVLPSFPFAPKPKKNKVNSLSKAYYTYMQQLSLPHFAEIESFLKNPRNSQFRDLYEDAAADIKGKLIAHTGQFETFDHAITYIADLVSADSSALQGKRRFVIIFLHYMYFTCDIGQHDTAFKAP